MEYFSAIKRNEVFKHAIIWMNLENTLSERNQSQKVTLCDSIYMKCPEQATLLRQVSGCQERGKWGVIYLICMDFLLRMMKMFWNYIVMVAWSYEYTKNWLVHFKSMVCELYINFLKNSHCYQQYMKVPSCSTSFVYTCYCPSLVLNTGSYIVGSHCFNCIFC